MTVNSQTELFISSYEGHILLWDKSHVFYNNRVKRQLALQSISEECNITTDETEKKIRGLRTSFGKQRLQIQKSEKSGAGTNELALPTWKSYNNLRFLWPGLDPPSRTTSSITPNAQNNEVCFQI